MTDWVEWHRAYDRGSSLGRRLEVVRVQLRADLDRRPEGEICVISVCAGQGRDVLPVVGAHPRRPDVRGRLVELDPDNTRIAAATAEATGLTGVEVVRGDASLTESYAGAVPASIVLVCGVFGNISDADIEGMIAQLPSLCARGATVIWTRGGRSPDLRPTVRRWFGGQGFEELFFQGEPEAFGVGVHRLAAGPMPFDPGLKLFSFLR